MRKKPTFKLFTLSSSQSHLEWDSIFGDKYRDAVSFELIEVHSPQDADAIVWDGIVGPKSQELIESLRPFLDQGIPLILTGERRAFVEESVVAEALATTGWKTIVLPPWGSVPEELLLSLTQLMERHSHV